MTPLATSPRKQVCTMTSPRGEFAEDGDFAEEGKFAQDGNFAQEGNVAEEGGTIATVEMDQR